MLRHLPPSPDGHVHQEIQFVERQVDGGGIAVQAGDSPGWRAVIIVVVAATTDA